MAQNDAQAVTAVAKGLSDLSTGTDKLHAAGVETLSVPSPAQAVSCPSITVDECENDDDVTQDDSSDNLAENNSKHDTDVDTKHQKQRTLNSDVNDETDNGNDKSADDEAATAPSACRRD